MSLADELRDLQQKHRGLKKLIAGETALGDAQRVKELERKFASVTRKMRKVQDEILEEAEDAERVAKKATKSAKKSTKSSASYDQIMGDVRSVDKALGEVRKTIKQLGSGSKEANGLRAEERRLVKLWQKLVKAAADAKHGR